MRTGDLTIRAATAGDEPAVAALLADLQLPVDGVHEHFDNFIVADIAGEIVGAAGFESYGSDALLRSVCVRRELQNTGAGATLVHSVIERARAHDIDRLYLLTTTASAYFPRFGFEPIERSAVSAAVQQSVEFTEACPASAQAMVLEL